MQKERTKVYLEKDKTYGNGESFIFLTYTCKGQKFFYTNFKCKAEFWDFEKGRIDLDKIKDKEAKKIAFEINEKVDEIKRKINKIAQKIEFDVEPRAELVKAKFIEEEQKEIKQKEAEYQLQGVDERKKEGNKTFLDFYKDFVKSKTQYDSVSESTRKKYNTCIEHLEMFVIHRKGVQLYPEDMTVQGFEQPFRHYLRFTYVQFSYLEDGVIKFKTKKDGTPIKEIGLAENSIVKDLKTIYSVCKYLFDEGISNNKEYRKFDLTEYTSDNPPLPPEYFKAILNAEFTDRPALQRTLDKFIIGCITSLRYEDLNSKVLKDRVYIDKKDLSLSYVELRSKKGKKEVSEVYYLTSIGAKRIIKYLNDDSCGIYALPPLSSKNFNENLREIGKILGFNKMYSKEIIKKEKSSNGKVQDSIIDRVPFYELMSSHMMRRTSVTTMKRKLDDRMTMKQSKHTTRVNLDKYNKFADEELARKLEATFSEYL